MAIHWILFDLDGTLLPMDQDVFLNAYFRGITKKIVPLGYDADELVKAIWQGTGAMIKNDGSYYNEEIFWDYFQKKFGEKSVNDIPVFDDFYRNEFQEVKKVCGYNPDAVNAVNELKQKGYKLVLATNPVFPATAVESRIKWAGLAPEDFELYTTYENSRFSKPNPAYYIDIVQKLGCAPDECLMVGNDVDEDMIAETTGMKVFLLTDCLINKRGTDISVYSRGGFLELLKYINKGEKNAK